MKHVSYQTTALRIRRQASFLPSFGLVLGTGFGGIALAMQVQHEWAYRDLPGFPEGQVSGHAGRLLLGTLEGVPLFMLNGRAHYYEGFELDEITFPIRVLAALGVTTLLLTNAAGGIRKTYRPGDFMVVSDHINQIGANPLRGAVPPGLQRFVDLTAVYDAELRRALKRAARIAKTRCHEGVYLAVSGPSFETPAEIRAFARWGADAVGMSTVPEAIVARQLGLRVAALSAITNAAAGRDGRNNVVSHEAVLTQAAEREQIAIRLVGAFLRSQDPARPVKGGRGPMA